MSFVGWCNVLQRKLIRRPRAREEMGAYGEGEDSVQLGNVTFTFSDETEVHINTFTGDFSSLTDPNLETQPSVGIT